MRPIVDSGLGVGLVLVMLAVAADDVIQETPSAPATPPSAESSATAAQPEYRAHALPTDTFKPSEEVSEDYAIPFPADI